MTRNIVSGTGQRTTPQTTTGNRVTGDYSSGSQTDGTGTTTQTVLDTATDAAESSTTSATVTDSQSTSSGNRHDGHYTATTESVLSTTITRGGTVPDDPTTTVTFGSTSVDNSHTDTAGNEVTGAVTRDTAGTDVYSFTQTVDRTGNATDYTLTASGTDTYSRDVTIDALTGQTSSVATGTDRYTLRQTGTGSSGIFEVNLSGSDDYSVTSTSKSRTGVFDNQTILTGTQTDDDTLATIATDRVLRQSGTTVDADTEQTVAGQNSLQGTDRYDALIDYLDPSNSSTGTVGMTTTSPTGPPLRLLGNTPVPTGGGRERLTGASTSSIDTFASDLTTTLSTATARGDQLTGVGSTTVPSTWTASATIESYTATGIDSTDQYCFPAGTEVLLADGTAKPIEQIQLGDQVAVATQTAVTTPTALPHASTSSLSRNHNLNLALPPSGQVTQLHRNQTKELLHLHIGDHTLTTTAGHPFYEATTQTWTLARDLAPGDRLQDQTGSELTITAITTEPVAETAIYNFAVAEHHQYHVRLPGTDHFVLVHNDSFGLNTYGSSLVPTIVASLGIDIDLSKQQQDKLAEIMAEFLVTMTDTANAVVDNAVPVALTVLGGVGAAYSISAGVSMIAAGGSLSGIAAGTTLVALGSDGLQSTVRTLLTGEYHPTYVQQGLTNLGLSQNEALIVEVGLSLLAPSAAGRLDSARAATYARTPAGRLEKYVAAERAARAARAANPTAARLAQHVDNLHATRTANQAAGPGASNQGEGGFGVLGRWTEGAYKLKPDVQSALRKEILDVATSKDSLRRADLLGKKNQTARQQFWNLLRQAEITGSTKCGAAGLLRFADETEYSLRIALKPQGRFLGMSRPLMIRHELAHFAREAKSLSSSGTSLFGLERALQWYDYRLYTLGVREEVLAWRITFGL